MAGNGPLPTGNARRKNPPTIPTTVLPAAGRQGESPDPPEGYKLGRAGRAFWAWAWATPQAAGWDDGSLYAIARRALLEDDLDTIGTFRPGLDLADLFGIERDEQVEAVEFLLGQLHSMVTGRLGIIAKMADLDKRLGLDPKAMLELRWKIVDEATPVAAPLAVKMPTNVRNIRPVDPALIQQQG